MHPCRERFNDIVSPRQVLTSTQFHGTALVSGFRSYLRVFQTFRMGERGSVLGYVTQLILAIIALFWQAPRTSMAGPMPSRGTDLRGPRGENRRCMTGLAAPCPCCGSCGQHDDSRSVLLKLPEAALVIGERFLG